MKVMEPIFEENSYYAQDKGRLVISGPKFNIFEPS